MQVVPKDAYLGLLACMSWVKQEGHLFEGNSECLIGNNTYTINREIFVDKNFRSCIRL